MFGADGALLKRSKQSDRLAVLSGCTVRTEVLSHVLQLYQLWCSFWEKPKGFEPDQEKFSIHPTLQEDSCRLCMLCNDQRKVADITRCALSAASKQDCSPSHPAPVQLIAMGWAEGGVNCRDPLVSVGVLGCRQCSDEHWDGCSL